MKPVERSYSIATLNDGTDGNYFLVQRIFRQLRMLKDENPQAFAGFHGLASEFKPLSGEDRNAIRKWGPDLIEYNPFISKLSATQNAKDVLDLCLTGRNSPVEKALRQVFSYFAGKEKPIGFKLISPFKHPQWLDPSSAKDWDVRTRVRGTIMKPTGAFIPSVDVVRPTLFARSGTGNALRITG